MREDMAKVLVERPREPARSRKGRTPRDLQDLPRFLGLRRAVKEGGDWKVLNENLAPLRRFLERQVGRPWSKVNSEIRARIDVGNEVQAHVLTHIDNYLHRNVTKKAPTSDVPCGLAFQRDWRSGGSGAVREGELYVDPDDGLIKRARRKLKGPRPQAATKDPHRDRWIGPMRRAVFEAGVWYAITLTQFELEAMSDGEGRTTAAFRIDGRVCREWIDPLYGPVWAHDTQKQATLAQRYGPGRVGREKRQLSRAELRKHGLQNEPLSASWTAGRR